MRATSPLLLTVAAAAARKQPRPRPGQLSRMATVATQLAPLPEVERISPAVIRILGGNPGKFTLQGTNTYLIGTGRDRLLIDTGEGKPSWIAALKRVLASEQGSRGGDGGGGGGGGEDAPAVRIVSALITHRHPDHVGGIPQLLALSPETRVHKHRDPEGAGSGSGSGTQAGGAAAALEEIRDGQTFAVEGATLTAVHTPGHTADHVVFVLREEEVAAGEQEQKGPRQALFTGDNVLGHGTAVFEDLGTYLRSLARMEGLLDHHHPDGGGAGGGGGGPAFPGHGPVLPSARDKIAEYIEHRRQREAQVLQTLGGSANANANEEEQGGEDAGADASAADNRRWWSSMELVKVIYRDVPETLHVPAQGGVVQVLRKLRDEDRVVLEGLDRWRLSDRSSL